MCADRSRDGSIKIPLKEWYEEDTKSRPYSQGYIETGIGEKDKPSNKYDVNKRDNVTGRVAAHSEAENGNVKALEALISNGANLNIQDFNGDTALHLLVKKWQPGSDNYCKCLNLILDHSERSVNIPNKDGLTPIFLAALEKENSQPVNLILDKCPEVDLDTFRSEDNKTAREVIQKNFPDRENLPEIWQPKKERGIADYKYRLFYFLQIKKENKFCEALRESQATDGYQSLHSFRDFQSYTYFQRACERGLKKPVEALVMSGFDPNESDSSTDRPVFIAAIMGHSKILSILLDLKQTDIRPNSKGETLLHVVVKTKEEGFRGFFECLQKLLKTNIDVNSKDMKGRTPLHFAVKFSDDDCIFALIDAGAKLDIDNQYKKTPLSHISAETLKKYLDSKISTSTVVKDHSTEIKIDYNIAIASGNCNNHLYDVRTELLSAISKSQRIRHLLAHPVLSTIILFKWQRIRLYFYLLLSFYTLFAVAFSAYVYFGEVCFTYSQAAEPCFTNGTVWHTQNNEYYVLFTTNLLLLFVCISFSFEICQFILNPSIYIRDLENYVQVIKLIATSLCLLTNCATKPENRTYCHQVNAVAVLFVWMELFFVIGNHPKLSFFLEMFRAASKFLLLFLGVHITLIVAFAFSFYELFKREEENPFSSIHGSILKTLTMVTGEFDVDKLPMTSVGSYFIFCSFIFLLTIVLFNLLIGLAVKSTSHIEENTFLCSCVAQIPIISYYEKMIFKDPGIVSRLFDIRRCFKSRKQRKNTCGLYPILRIDPKSRMKITYAATTSNENVTALKETVWFNFPKEAMANVNQILTNKKDEHQQAFDRMDELKENLEKTKLSLEEELRTVRCALVKILERLDPEVDTDVYAVSAKKKMKQKFEHFLRKKICLKSKD